MGGTFDTMNKILDKEKEDEEEMSEEKPSSEKKLSKLSSLNEFSLPFITTHVQVYVISAGQVIASTHVIFHIVLTCTIQYTI